MPSPILLFSSSADQVFEQGLTPAMTLRACCLPGSESSKLSTQIMEAVNVRAAAEATLENIIHVA